MTQLTISEAVHLKPQTRAIVDVLRDGRPHQATEFIEGIHGFYCLAVSQRVGEARRAGFPIRNTTPNGGVATYQMEVAT